MRQHLSPFLYLSCATIALVSILLGVVGPLLPELAREQDSDFFASLVMAGHPLGSLFAAIPAVLIGRRYGVHRVIFGGGLIMALSTVLFWYPGESYWVFAARVGQGVGSCMVWQSIFAWVVSNVGPSRRAVAIGTLLSAATVGGLLAPATGALSTEVGRWIFLAPALALVACCCYFLRVPAYDFAERTGVKVIGKALAQRIGLAGIALSAVASVVAVGLYTTLPLLLDQRGYGPFEIGVVLTAAAALTVFVTPWAGRIVDHGGLRRLLIGGFTLAAALLLILAALAASLSSAVIAILAIVTIGAVALPGTSLVSRAMHEQRVDQTVSQGLSTMIWAPSALLGSLAVGLASSPPAAVFALAVGVALFALLLSADALRQNRRARLRIS